MMCIRAPRPFLDVIDGSFDERSDELSFSELLGALERSRNLRKRFEMCCAGSEATGSFDNTWIEAKIDELDCKSAF